MAATSLRPRPGATSAERRLEDGYLALVRAAGSGTTGIAIAAQP